MSEFTQETSGGFPVDPDVINLGPPTEVEVEPIHLEEGTFQFAEIGSVQLCSDSQEIPADWHVLDGSVLNSSEWPAFVRAMRITEPTFELPKPEGNLLGHRHIIRLGERVVRPPSPQEMRQKLEQLPEDSPLRIVLEKALPPIPTSGPDPALIQQQALLEQQRMEAERQRLMEQQMEAMRGPDGALIEGLSLSAGLPAGSDQLQALAAPAPEGEFAQQMRERPLLPQGIVEVDGHLIQQPPSLATQAHPIMRKPNDSDDGEHDHG